MCAPSIYTHVINGILILIAVIILFKYYSEIVNTSPYRLLSIVLLLSIAIGVHGLSHLGLEQSYGFNPLRVL